MSRIWKLLIGVVSILLIISILAVGGWQAFIGMNTPRSFPQVNGEIHLTGLEQPVEVYRDTMGIPHIYATTTHDLFFAQGYVHAQDRFWQMDFWRHIGSAQLSEMFGESEVDTDTFLRALGWRQIAEEEWNDISDDSKFILSAYADGVNAYLADHHGSQLSLEYAILGLPILAPSYQPEPWTPVNSLTWGKVMAWDLAGNMSEEIARAVLLKTLTPEQVAQLYPDYPADHPIIVSQMSGLPSGTTGSSQMALQVPDALFSAVANNLDQVNALVGKPGNEIGSNEWVFGGSRTESGKPLLANDPHLSIQMPSIWYQIDLQCKPKSDACSLSVAGFSFAGVPGVVIGHNDRIAWGFTNVGPDVMDLYVEKVNPANPNQYEVNGKWVDFETRQETLDVAGGDPVTVTVRATRHGPVISDSYGPLKDPAEPEPSATPFKDRAGIDLPDDYVIALRWTALEPNHIFDAVWGFDRAGNFEDFRESAQSFFVPAQNLLYADVDGNIGYQMPGNIPIRAKGDGTLPVPGWTDDYEWQGYIPFDELPYTYNPPEDFIAAVNNQVAPNAYPYLITKDWDYGFRAQRIVELIGDAPAKVDATYVQQMQGDDLDLNAATLVPILKSVELNGDLSQARDLLQNWDYQDRMDSKPAALFAVFWSNLLKRTFDDDLPEDYRPGGGDRWFEVVRDIVNDPQSAWWDDKSTVDAIETRDEIFAETFRDAVAELSKEYGNNTAKWPTWGELHTATFRNQSLGESGVPFIESLFNRGPFQSAGGASIVNATGWDTTESYELTSLPSMRMIADLGDLNNSLTVHTTGESGHVGSPHYSDMADLWRNIQYYQMLWDEQEVTSTAESHLTLLP
jgi:penicillin G amidase